MCLRTGCLILQHAKWNGLVIGFVYALLIIFYSDKIVFWINSIDLKIMKDLMIIWKQYIFIKFNVSSTTFISRRTIIRADKMTYPSTFQMSFSLVPCNNRRWSWSSRFTWNFISSVCYQRRLHFQYSYR